MKIVTVLFDRGKSNTYDAGELLKGYEKSVKRTGNELEVVRVSALKDDLTAKRSSWKIKLRAKALAWRDVVLAAKEPIILTDLDMMLVRDVRPSFDSLLKDSWDVAITTRSQCPPINAGVMCVRPTHNARAFMEHWLEWTLFFEQHVDQYQESWHLVFSATDQAALAKILMSSTNEARIKCLPCEIWNCADAEWETFDLDRTIFVHVKSRLRDRCFEKPFRLPVTEKQKQAINSLVSLWKYYRNEEKEVNNG